MHEQGGISVETKHIFPIIKKWLYSDKEIFLREIVSNSCDAITKIKRMISLGEVMPEDIYGYESGFKITVELNSEKKTLKITDNGIGMNAEEVKKYINQIALSGALDFIEKYETDEGGEQSSKDLKDETVKNGIIGHFGLGFYSAFMVSESVDIRTRSFAGGPGVFWTCTEEGSYELFEGDCELSPEKPDMGTEVILHIGEENNDFLSEHKIADILQKYCAFMPYEIYFVNAGKEHKHKKDEKCEECETPVNDISPLWTKNPSSCEKTEYLEFYKKVFRDFKEPLFYIHINADYPLNFKGILYFPKLNTQFDSLEGEVKLYYNQVFVADNIKEVIPEYLLMLKGVLDCPELPLNVSRSYLQNSGYVSKISAHIVKKVCDKLSSLFSTERSEYEGFWPDIKTFVLYGCLRDQKYYDRIKDVIIYKTTENAYRTLSEYIEAAPKPATDKDPVTIYYTNNPDAQAVYVGLHKRAGREILILENIIETQFISFAEMKYDSPKVKFVRVDSNISESGEDKGEGEKTEGKKDKKAKKEQTKKPESAENSELIELFKEAIGVSENPEKFANLTIEVADLPDDKIPALLTLSEEARRMSEIMKQYKMIDSNLAGLPESDCSETLIINSKNALIQKLAKAKNKQTARYIYMLSLVSKRELSAGELENFIDYSIELCDSAIDTLDTIE
ncbi:MAG: molecular chaperone HtpG [Oscillospiraceae bacterium]|nr:molecular chaperone HtpG [Oscillospiraceae bacterium]